jgi:hypothetical protein
METQVRTPQSIFMHPQRLVVPLFQRPYVWNEENQWEPLWDDVVRTTERVLRNPRDRHYPHFLGAVVLQQVQNPVGTMQERIVIDGQQRLTTLQLLFDALHAELLTAGATAPATRLETLVTNAEAFCRHPEDRFKVWPTNRDRPAFNAVMGAKPPVNYEEIEHRGERMVEAHRYFSLRAKEWLSRAGAESLETRAATIETVVRELLQMVVIDLTAEENAQEIFETLNARGAQLTAADLIKNFIFQQLLEAGEDVEIAYVKYWQEFETAFWETEISVGRLRYSRSSLFLNHWLISQCGEEVVAREIFSRFKRFAIESKKPMLIWLQQINLASRVYRRVVESGEQSNGAIDEFGVFAYRTSVMESEVIKPLVLWLFDPSQPEVRAEQIKKALASVESWMVRRMLVRATTKNYNQIVPELIAVLSRELRAQAGDVIEKYLTSQTSESRYWPDDDELRGAIRIMPAYRRLSRARLRMVLEAIEDHKRGWKDGSSGLGGERVARGKYAIEHIMPRKWQAHWPVAEGARAEQDRESIIHTFGNLTLLTSRLNSKVSNGPWQGASGKKMALENHDVLLLNRELRNSADGEWSDSAIRLRSDDMSRLIIQIWPTPPAHRSGFVAEVQTHQRRLDIVDLINAGYLQAGAKLSPRQKKYAESIAVLLPDGRLDINGAVYDSPSMAARAIAGKSMNGWWFFLTDPAAKKSLKDVRLAYLESFADDFDDDAEDDAEDDV